MRQDIIEIQYIIKRSFYKWARNLLKMEREWLQAATVSIERAWLSCLNMTSPASRTRTSYLLIHKTLQKSRKRGNCLSQLCSASAFSRLSTWTWLPSSPPTPSKTTLGLMSSKCPLSWQCFSWHTWLDLQSSELSCQCLEEREPSKLGIFSA